MSLESGRRGEGRPRAQLLGIHGWLFRLRQWPAWARGARDTGQGHGHRVRQGAHVTGMRRMPSTRAARQDTRHVLGRACGQARAAHASVARSRRARGVWHAWAHVTRGRGARREGVHGRAGRARGNAPRAHACAVRARAALAT